MTLFILKELKDENLGKYYINDILKLNAILEGLFLDRVIIKKFNSLKNINTNINSDLQEHFNYFSLKNININKNSDLQEYFNYFTRYFLRKSKIGEGININ